MANAVGCSGQAGCIRSIDAAWKFLTEDEKIHPRRIVLGLHGAAGGRRTPQGAAVTRAIGKLDDLTDDKQMPKPLVLVTG